jgi:hypothetical protein
MSRVVLTKKMLEIIEQGMIDRGTIVNDELAFDDAPNKKKLEKELEICQKVDDWIYAIRQKRGYNEK